MYLLLENFSMYRSSSFFTEYSWVYCALVAPRPAVLNRCCTETLRIPLSKHLNSWEKSFCQTFDSTRHTICCRGDLRSGGKLVKIMRARKPIIKFHETFAYCHCNCFYAIEKLLNKSDILSSYIALEYISDQNSTTYYHNSFRISLFLNLSNFRN